jgi:ATP-dependent DNA helicase DinG
MPPPRRRSAVELHLTPAAAELLRREIRRARGNEVCFLAKVGEDGAVDEPRVVARGNLGAVLAMVRNPEPGGLLIHNHPSGVLEPSEADFAVAAALFEQGLGFAITNNEADELYVAVEPPEEGAAEPLDLDVLDHDLGPAGPLASRHPRYEDRPQQRELTRLIGGLYNQGGVGLAEAGTGTGKSVAYLIPAIRWAVQNRERTVVSTNTINLQEQLVEKDLPLLRRALGEPFRFALVKGRRNYVSIRRAMLARDTAAQLFGPEQQAELAGIVDWLQTTRDGSLSDLSFRPSAEVWDEVASESDVCLRAKCPHFEDCHYQRARRDASAANVVVVNHHLLFSDLAVRRMQGNWTAPAVLPMYKRLVLDEAHNLEEAATSHLGFSVSRRSLFRTLRRLEHRGKGLIPAFSMALASRDDLLSQGARDTIDEKILLSLEGARERASAVFSFLSDVFAGGEVMARLDDAFAAHPVWPLGLDDALSALLDNLASLLLGIGLLRERIAADDTLRRQVEAQLMELRGAATRVEMAADALRNALRPGEERMRMVRWMERAPARDGREANLTLNAAPLDLSGVLRESLFQNVETVVLTSATLSTQQNDFRFMRQRLGLTESFAEEHRVAEGVFPSPFEYGRQALVGIPTDVPLPAGENDPRHDEATVRAVIEHAKISDGGLFVLFTSYRALRHVASELRSRRADLEWPLFVHGEAPRAQLVERFTLNGRGILLGTTSFWEGVDVPGRPLRGLVIPKLPFKVPSEPVTAARIEAIEAAGGNSFLSYMLPSAAIRLKQGFGRLIRSQADHGVVLILDGRIAKKSYGRYFLDSLPPAPVVRGPWKQVQAAMIAFYTAQQPQRAAG